ncbi:MAG: hypothetical protein D6B27_08230 [Gammaproteobacteria bacterium]|mgnify:CR=1 FL=1|nr:MAG: hypothetical protein D6B27_08230 [Gammaproteobacteria bacterium]
MVIKYSTKVIQTALLILFLAGCASVFTEYGRLQSSAEKHYKAGNYDQAFIDCASSLALKPDYEEAQELIMPAFRRATAAHIEQINHLQQSNDKFRWDYLVVEYDAMNTIYSYARKVPPIITKKSKTRVVFEYIDYTADRSHAVQMAAAAHYDEGMRMSNYADKTSQRLAALEFKKAMQYVRGYKNALSMYQQCREAAMRRIAIIPFVDKSGKYGNFGDVPGLIVDLSLQEIMADKLSMEFVEFINRGNFQHLLNEYSYIRSGIVDQNRAVQIGKTIGASEIVVGTISQIIYSPVSLTSHREKYQRTVVTGKQRYKDKKGNQKERDITQKVSARVTTHTETAMVRIVVSYQIIDVETSRILSSKVVEGDYDYEQQWATYKGDKRAFDNDGTILELTEKVRTSAPSVELMVNDAVKEISHDISTEIKAFLDRLY